MTLVADSSQGCPATPGDGWMTAGCSGAENLHTKNDHKDKSMGTSTWTASRCVAAAVLLCTLSAAQAATVAISNAAFAATYVRDCRSSPLVTNPDRCEASPLPTAFDNTMRDTQEMMVLGGTVASVQTSLPHGIVAGEASRSYIDATGAAGELVLRQGAFSRSYSRVSGHSLGLQSFGYSGADESRTIQNVLTFDANVIPNAVLRTPGAGGNWLAPVVYMRTRVSVFSLLVDSFDYDPLIPIEVQNIGFKAQAAAAFGYRLEGEINTYEGIVASGHTTQLDFNVEAGRYYFVESYLGLWARFGGTLDSTHTFRSTLGAINDSGSFVADQGASFTAAAPLAEPLRLVASLTVPEPSTLAVAALGLALMGVAGRRRRG